VNVAAFEQQARVETPVVIATPPTVTTKPAELVVTNEQTTETEEAELVFTVVDVLGNEGEPIQLNLEMLEGNRLLEMLRKMPNGHYRVKFKPAGGFFQIIFDLKVDGSTLTDISEESGGSGQPGSGQGAALPRDTELPQVVDANPFAPPALTTVEAGTTVLNLPEVPAEFVEAALLEAELPQDEPGLSRWRLAAPLAGGALVLGGLAASSREEWEKRVDQALEAGRHSLGKAARLLRKFQ
jgi:hypothetical protein